jgi:hypothetical protein
MSHTSRETSVLLPVLACATIIVSFVPNLDTYHEHPIPRPIPTKKQKQKTFSHVTSRTQKWIFTFAIEKKIDNDLKKIIFGFDTIIFFFFPWPLFFVFSRGSYLCIHQKSKEKH